MPIIINSSHEYSGYQGADKTLQSLGVSVAKPSRNEKLTPQHLTEKICRAYGVDGFSAESVQQVEPGKVWQALSVDLFWANMDQSHWMWSDPRTVYLLDYWLGFDGQIQFLLTYSTIESAAARLTEHTRSEAGSVEKAIANWQAYNEEILRFYNTNPERCLLVSTEALKDNLGGFLDLCSSKFELDSNNEAIDSIAHDNSCSPLNQLMGFALRNHFPEAHDLYRELESAADLPWLGSGDPLKHIYSAWPQLDDLKSQLDAYKSHSNGLKSQLDELKKENELLLLQLHQVQEELERYFLLYQVEKKESEKKESEKKESAGSISHTDKDIAAGDGGNKTFKETIIDLRSLVDGSNWHHAENDGRWAGPGTRSTLKLPLLPEGRYKLTLNVVGAIQPDILHGMNLSLNGTELKLGNRWGLKGPWGSYVLRLKKGFKEHVSLPVKFEIDAAHSREQQELVLTFPRTVAPTELGKDDNRRLAIRVQTVEISKR